MLNEKKKNAHVWAVIISHQKIMQLPADVIKYLLDIKVFMNEHIYYD